MTAQQIAQNVHFQAMAASDALQLLSEKSDISFKELLKQLPHNQELMSRVAEMVAFAAQITADSLSVEV